MGLSLGILGLLRACRGSSPEVDCKGTCELVLFPESSRNPVSTMAVNLLAEGSSDLP